MAATMTSWHREAALAPPCVLSTLNLQLLGNQPVFTTQLEWCSLMKLGKSPDPWGQLLGSQELITDCGSPCSDSRPVHSASPSTPSPSTISSVKIFLGIQVKLSTLPFSRNVFFFLIPLSKTIVAGTGTKPPAGR